jgi:hypothetical protein
MWNVIPVIIGATGIVSKSLKSICKQYQDNTQYILYKNRHTRNITHITRKVLYKLRLEA